MRVQNNSYACGTIYAENGMLTFGYYRENQCENVLLFCIDAAKQFINTFIQPI